VAATSERPCVVTTRVSLETRTVWVRLVGAVEMGAEPALDVAVERVRAVAPAVVLVDLAGVTFAGSLLAHFLLRVHAAAGGARISLYGATRSTLLVVTATGGDAFVTRKPGSTR